MYPKTMLAAVAVLVTGIAAVPAKAQRLTRVVSYHDLDLASPADAAVLRHRVRRAVDAVCRRPDPAHPTGTEDQDCRAEVAAQVQPEMLKAIQLAEARAASQLAAR